MSAGRFSSITLSVPRTNSRKDSFLATKSVSVLTSIIAAVLPSSLFNISTIPSAAMREDFFAATESPFSRRIFIALSKSPSASIRAFLQSIIPHPVFARSSDTILAFIVAIYRFILLGHYFIILQSLTGAGLKPRCSRQSQLQLIAYLWYL